MQNGSAPSGNGHSNRWNSMNPVNGQSQPSGEHGARDDEITLQELVGMLWGGWDCAFTGFMEFQRLE